MSGHGGNLRRLAQQSGIPESDILDFSANINPLGPPEWLRQVISASVSSVVHYPDPECQGVVAAASALYGAEPGEIVVGNGSSELLFAVMRSLAPERTLVPVPSYIDYVRASSAVDRLQLDPEQDFALDLDRLALSPGTVVLLGQPNNPTGRCFNSAALRTLANQHPDCWFVVDEAFADFVDGLDRLTSRRPSNVIVLLSQTKNYAIPGLRLGLAVCCAELAARVRTQLAPWSVNTIAQAVGEAALKDREYLVRTRESVRQWRAQLAARLRAIPGLRVYRGEANFLLARVDRSDHDAETLAATLLGQGIAIRVCANFEGLDARYFRVAVRNEAENARLCRAIETAFCGASAILERRRTPAIMFQGTASNAGKSVLTTAFCRILLQDGFCVAPFKAQNMSLNSYVTRDGREMGRAQVVQAQACRLEPDVRMNPVLLKPSSDTGSQVIVRGRAIGNMQADTYFQHKAEAYEQVKLCYDELSSEHEAMVLEGAGSPAEVNLKAHDIVNMMMAEYAGAPVLLVGDIDRGGVFASLIGCMEVFTERERRQVCGFIVNRFRGDESLLGDAFDYVLRHTGKPVLGLVPYLRKLGLPEEDSVSFKEGATDDRLAVGDRLEIGVIDLPHISNFTDFDALRIEPDVCVRVIRSPSELGAPAAVILPGSKNVPGDLHFLRETGFVDAILALRTAQVIGICGGFQMLGRIVEDPHCLESAGNDEAGLGMLAVSTSLEREKTLLRTRVRHLESGLDVVGYEIHHGQTRSESALPVFESTGGVPMGARSKDGRIWGCYLHGLFDEDAFRRWFIDDLRIRTGRAPAGKILARYDIEPALDRLAETVRRRLPIERIYRTMNLR